MTLTDELKILDDKIKANQAQHDLEREASKISALSSRELDKYEYLTGDNLGHKPGVVEQDKFEYSPLGKVFNKGLEKEDKKEELLKKLKNIEDKKEKQLNIFENKDSNQLGIKSVTNIFDEELSQEAKNILIKLNAKEETIDYKRLSFKRDKNLEFDFRDHKLLKEFFKDIYYKKFSTEEAEIIQEEFNAVLTALEKYKPKDSECKNKKLKLLENVKWFYDGREIIINSFKNKIFPLYHEENIFGDKDEDDSRDENDLISYKKLEELIFFQKEGT